MARKAKAWPVPEILAPDVKWKIEDRRDGGAHCSRASGVFAVPLTPGPFQRAVALHEAAHVKWSPAKPPKSWKGDMRSLLACEDYRVNTLVNVRMPDVRDWYQRDLLAGTGELPPLAEQIEGLLKAGREKEATLLVMAAGGARHAESNGLFAMLPARGREAIRDAELAMHRSRRIRGRITRAYVTFLATKKAAAIIDAYYAPSAEEQAGGCDIDKELSAQWSPMSIEEPPRTLPTLTQRSIRWRASDAGPIVRDCSRLHADGQIFGRRVVRKERGGVLIVDGSSSVGLSTVDLNRLVTHAPAATIAIYTEMGKRATLTVLARHGKRVEAVTGNGFGNGCDAAALLWGARLPEKGVRVWLSDGQVCSYAGQSEQMRVETVAAFLAGNYQRAKDVDEAIAALAGKKLSSRPIVT